MNEVPPNQGDADEVDDLYRRASAADASRPSDAVRRAVLDHAAQLAAQRSREAGPVKIDFTRPAANQPWRRPAIFGTLAAAALAGLMIAPQFFSPRLSDTSERQSAAPTATESANAPQTPAPRSQPPVADSQAPVAGSQAAVSSPPVPFPAPPLQANDHAARMKSDRRRDLNADVPARSAGPVDTSPPSTAADSARAQTESLANVLTTPAQQPVNAGRAAADARRMQGITSNFGALSARRAQTAASVPAPSMALAAPAADQAAQLRRAAEAGDLTALQALLDDQPIIDARDDGGRTALMLAVLHGHAQTVDVLLAHGADPNAADARGTTPLQAAIAGDQPTIAAALRRDGAR